MKKVEIKEFKGLQAFVKPGEYELVYNANSKKLNIIGIDTDDVVGIENIHYVYGKEKRFSINKGQVLAFMVEKKNIFGNVNYQLELIGD